jgi:hypothetical protein
MIRDRDQRPAVMNLVVNFLSVKCCECFEWVSNCCFLRKVSSLCC